MPRFNFSFDVMRLGVFQHIDREYTYDVIPDELLNGWLFQGVHRVPEGTAVEFNLVSPATVYFFFHPDADGGYSSIFADLRDRKRCTTFPQYDLRGGDHGRKMVMYRLDADAGSYALPRTTEDRACFSIVFQPQDEALQFGHTQAAKPPAPSLNPPLN
jgi:hypothetical protein